MKESLYAVGSGCTFSPIAATLPLSAGKGREIVIPVLPYVAKFLACEYPAGYKLSEADALGTLLYQLLRRPEEFTRYDLAQARYSARFSVFISQAKLENRGLGKVNSHLVNNLNTFLEDQIRSKMYDFVDFCLQYKVKKKAAAIREFMQRYNLTEEDVAYDTLLKAHQRHARSKKK